MENPEDNDFIYAAVKCITPFSVTPKCMWRLLTAELSCDAP